jgi:predicted Fe-Mo cluster-binding NifX family protein
MRVAFSTSGTTLDAPLDARFGRAPKFLVYDTESESVETVDNEQNLQAAQGAGIQAATTVARTNADSLVTGHCGPKAFTVLSGAGIRVFLTDVATIAEALERLQSGALVPAASADVEGHWV